MFFFFFKQKTAYEIGTGDWSSDVCSSDLAIAEVFAAGEDPIEGASRDDLVAGLIRHGHRHARAILSEDDLERLVREQARDGDMVVCLGAGTISTWANGLPERLSEEA